MSEISYWYINFSRLSTVLTSFLLAFGLYRQVWKIYKTRSAKDFALSLITALLISEISWLNYGVAIDEWPIILIASLNLPAILLSGWGYFLYGRRK